MTHKERDLEGTSLGAVRVMSTAALTRLPLSTLRAYVMEFTEHEVPHVELYERHVNKPDVGHEEMRPGGFVFVAGYVMSEKDKLVKRDRPADAVSIGEDVHVGKEVVIEPGSKIEGRVRITGRVSIINSRINSCIISETEDGRISISFTEMENKIISGKGNINFGKIQEHSGSEALHISGEGKMKSYSTTRKSLN